MRCVLLYFLFFFFLSIIISYSILLLQKDIAKRRCTYKFVQMIFDQSKWNVEKKVITLAIEGKITRNTNKSLLQNSRSSNVPNTRNPRNIPEYKILEVYKSTRVITIVLRFTRNKLIIGRQAKVVVIVNKNQIYRTLLWRFHKGKPNSKGGLGSGPLVIPLAHADLTHMHLFFGQRNGVECVARW